MKRILLALAALAALVPAMNSCKKAETIKVMSYNVRLGVGKDGDNAWDLRKEATRRQHSCRTKMGISMNRRN